MAVGALLLLNNLGWLDLIRAATLLADRADRRPGGFFIWSSVQKRKAAESGNEPLL